MANSASVEPDREMGRGYARVLVECEVPEGFAPRLILRRPGSNLAHLGREGWQTAEHLWEPEKSEGSPQGLALIVGPDLVRHMENGNYRLTLCDAARSTNIVLPLVWRDIPQPIAFTPPRTGLRRGRAEVSIAGAAVEARPASEAPPPLAPPPPAAPLPTQEPEKLERKAETVEPGPLPRPRPFPARLFAALGVVLLLLVGGGVYWLERPVPHPDGGAGRGLAKIDPKPPVLEPSPKPPVVEPSPKPTVVQTPLERARAALRDPSLSAPAAVDLARELGKVPGSGDATYLLYDYAADKGNKDAALALGGYFDPLNTGDTGSIKKDARQAAKYYRQAAASGNVAATEKLQALRDWANQEAAKGNAEAARLAKEL